MSRLDEVGLKGYFRSNLGGTLISTGQGQTVGAGGSSHGRDKASRARIEVEALRGPVRASHRTREARVRASPPFCLGSESSASLIFLAASPGPNPSM